MARFSTPKVEIAEVLAEIGEVDFKAYEFKFQDSNIDVAREDLNRIQAKFPDLVFDTLTHYNCLHLSSPSVNPRATHFELMAFGNQIQAWFFIMDNDIRVYGYPAGVAIGDRFPPE